MAAAKCDMSLAARDKANNTKEEQGADEVKNDLVKLSVQAHEEFRKGDANTAQLTMIRCFDPKVLLDDNYHHELFLKTGDNHQLIYRNNLAILKETTLRPGSAEVLFRVSLDLSMKYTTGSLAKRLSWLRNPYHARAAFSAILYSLRCFPMNPRLWVHAAEACCIYLCSQSEELMFEIDGPDSEDFFMLQTTRDTSHPLNDLNMIKTYMPHVNNSDEVEPSYEFAENCLAHARRIMRPNNNNDRDSINGHVSEVLDETELTYILMLTNSAFVALRLHKFQQVVKFTDKLFSLDNVPLKYKFVAMCCRDLARFQLGEASWEIFQPIILEDHIAEFKGAYGSEKSIKAYLSRINMRRKYLEVLACLMDPRNLKLALSRMEEYFENNTEFPRELLALFLFLKYKVSHSRTLEELQIKLTRVHQLLNVVSPRYCLEFRHESSPISIDRYLSKLRHITQTEVDTPASDSQTTTRAKPNLSLIKISQKDGKAICIPI